MRSSIARLAAVFGVAVIATVAVAASSAIGAGSPPATAGATADATLTPAASPAPAYRYTKSEVAWLMLGSGRYSVLAPQTREIWIAPDGSGRLRTAQQGLQFFGPNDAAEWQGHEWNEIKDARYDPGTLVYAAFPKLPGDPAAARDTLTRYFNSTADGPRKRGEPQAWKVLTEVRQLLWETVAPPEFSARLIPVLRATPGVTITANVRDRAGRAGTAFAATSSESPRIEHTLILADDGRLLGETHRLVEPSPKIDAAPPVVVGWAVYLDARVVSSLDDVGPN